MPNRQAPPHPIAQVHDRPTGTVVTQVCAIPDPMTLCGTRRPAH